MYKSRNFISHNTIYRKCWCPPKKKRRILTVHADRRSQPSQEVRCPDVRTAVKFEREWRQILPLRLSVDIFNVTRSTASVAAGLAKLGLVSNCYLSTNQTCRHAHVHVRTWTYSYMYINSLQCVHVQHAHERVQLDIVLERGEKC